MGVRACWVVVGRVGFSPMSERAEHWEYFQDLYRFAMVLMADSDRAMGVVTEALEDALRRPRSHGDLDRLLTLLFKEVRERALRTDEGRATVAGRRGKDPDLPENAADALGPTVDDDVRSAIRGLAEPGRSALALLYLDVLEPEEIQRILGVTDAGLADLLGGARAGLHGSVALGAAVE